MKAFDKQTGEILNVLHVDIKNQSIELELKTIYFDTLVRNLNEIKILEDDKLLSRCKETCKVCNDHRCCVDCGIHKNCQGVCDNFKFNGSIKNCKYYELC